MALIRPLTITPPAPRTRVTRSWAWRLVKRAHLRKHPTCAACGNRYHLTVHHIVPVSVDRTLELVPSNLITLCERSPLSINCHLFIGHGGKWHTHNAHVVRDAAQLLTQVQATAQQWCTIAAGRTQVVRRW